MLIPRASANLYATTGEQLFPALIIDVKRPPHYDEWECSITFNGKDKSADFNADMCLFLEEFAEYREEFQNNRISAKRYKELQDKDLAYYSSTTLEEKPEV